MKKYVAFVLLTIFFFSAIPSRTAEAETVKVQAGKAYAKIVQLYREARQAIEDAAGDWERYDKIYDYYEKKGVSMQCLRYCVGDNRLAYRIMDYNGDGSPELFIGSVYRSPEPFIGHVWESASVSIIDIYTFHKGKAVRLLEIGERSNICALYKNGIIGALSSGGASCSITAFYKLPKQGGKLKPMLEWEVGLTDWNDAVSVVVKKTENGKKSQISQKQGAALIKKYEKPIKVTFYKLDKKAVANMKKGLFTYPNQKKWRYASKILWP